MARGYGSELIQENDATAGNTDSLDFVAGIADDQVWFRQVGKEPRGEPDRYRRQGGAAELVSGQPVPRRAVPYLGRQDAARFASAGPGQRDGDFSPPGVGQTTLPPSYQSALLPVIAAGLGALKRSFQVICPGQRVRILVVHQNFPGQFGHFVREWAKRPGWDVRGLGSRKRAGTCRIRAPDSLSAPSKGAPSSIVICDRWKRRCCTVRRPRARCWRMRQSEVSFRTSSWRIRAGGRPSTPRTCSRMRVSCTVRVVLQR